MGITLTEFHVLLAYSSRLVALSLYTYAIVYEDIWPVVSLLLGVLRVPYS